MRRIRELDGLRALAILLVLGCHYPGFARLAGRLPEFGWMGVDIFFVLSGYLITTILLGLRHRSSPYTTFYSRRLLRILPPYLAATLAIIALGLLAHEHWVLTRSFLVPTVLFLQATSSAMYFTILDILRHPRWYLTHLPSLLATAHHLPVGLAGMKPFLLEAPSPYWSLSIEEYFYLLWAPVVLRCSRPVIVWTGAVICVAEPLLRWMANTNAAYFGLAYRFDALIYGVFLALLLERWRRGPVPSWYPTLFYSIFAASAAGIAAILFAIRPILGREIRSSGLLLVLGLPLLCMATAAVLGLLVLRADSDWWLARLLRTHPLQFLGTISYTMYLTHMIAGYIVFQAARALHRPDSLLLPQAIISSLLTILIARASWHYIEKPVLRWKDSRFPAVPHPPEPVLV